MNECQGSPAEEYLERYLKGSLPEQRARSFEEHFFECAVCLEQLEALEAVTLELAAQPRARARSLRKRKPRHWPYYVAEAIAGVVALALLGWGLVRLMERQPGSSAGDEPQAALPAAPGLHAAAARLAALADTSLPPYNAGRLHGSGWSAEFSAGMQAYGKHDCEAVVASLQRVGRSEPQYETARLYEGICQMQLKQLDLASDTLQSAAYTADSPQQEAAFYYLAQTELGRDNATNAEQDLVRTVLLHGDYERRAAAQLATLRSTSAR